MFEPPFPSTASDWRHLIERAASDRCDLDVLLKDEWRHKVAVRDDTRNGGPIKEQLLVIDGEVYARLKGLLLNNSRISIRALVLTGFHRVLGAYGQGSSTVVAYIEAVATCRMQTVKLLPTIVEHAQQLELTCVEAGEAIERALLQEDAYTSPAELLQRGLFDAVLMLTDDGNPLVDMPPFPLVSVVRDVEAQGHLQWKIAYAADLFEERVIAGVLELVREVLNQLALQPTQRVVDLELVSGEQKGQLESWNNTDGDFPAETRLEKLFEDAVRQSPEHDAIVCGDFRLTYRELNECCNHLAYRLLDSTDFRSGELIALYLDKSHLVIIATLGIWKAGAAYVPIDPTYPADRVLFTLRDTQANRIITNRHHSARLKELLGSEHPALQIIEVETMLEAETRMDSPNKDPRLPLGTDEVAYVTYTSGTTGVPKGVAKYHRNVVNSITDLSVRYDMRRAGEERVALFGTFVFEPSLRQTLIALINSQTLVVVPDDVRLDPSRFPVFVAQHGITYLNGTGSVLRHFDLRACLSLKKILLVGEELTASGLRQLREKFAGEIVNEYSFTETTFVTSIKVFAPGVVERSDRSIGRPLRNVKCYVLARNLKQLPIGAIGELYIGGCGIACGYLKRDSLTAERFLPNPFQTEQDKLRGHNRRMYKTGDLARMLPNGEIEFMGRSDFQLKLNGIRVEPGEIEARATEYPGVLQCVVVPRHGPGDWCLIGYFVADATCEVTEAELLHFLESRLIRVMVPARMVRLPSIPININGKVDRLALPNVHIHGSAVIGEIVDAHLSAQVAGGSSLLDTLRDIWCFVLGISAASIHADDDFFRLGGHSISCIRLLMRIWERLRLVVTIDDIFRLKTLGNLADYLAKQSGAPPMMSPIEPSAPIEGQSVRLRANGLQQGLLYHALKSGPGDDAYVMQSIYRYRCPIDPDLLKKAWSNAQRKYPSLRLRFEWSVEPLQVVEPDERPLYWRFIDLSEVASAEAQEAQIRNLQQRDRAERYTLAAGRLFRVYLIKQRNDLFALIFSCHHIILDGWSLSVLLDDVHRMYFLLSDKHSIDLAVDAAYVAAQRYWESHRDDHVGYWTEVIERVTERGDFSGLLNEKSRYKVALNSYDRVIEHKTKRLIVRAELTAAIKARCAANRLTLHSVVQFVWHKVLFAIGAGRNTVVGTIVSGRNLPIDDIEASVGLFINTLPLVVDHDDQASKTVSSAVADIQVAVNKMNSRSTVELGRLKSGDLKHRLFDTLLVLENHPRLSSEEEARQQRELLGFEWSYDSDKLDYPLALVAREEHGELAVNLWYAGELFDDSAIDTLLDAVETLVEQVAADMSQPVRDLEYVSAAVLARFNEWNRTDVAFPEDTTLNGVFEEVAARWPSEMAVVCGSARLTYDELNGRANQLAHHLLASAELHPNDLVALVMDKSERMVVAILAVWKAGAAYVPIDPDAPDDRVAFMLDDTRARLVVADDVYADRLRALPGGATRPVIGVERLSLGVQSRHNPVTAATSTDLAYAIYTSGTTGRPKAVLVEHRGVVNLHSSMEELFSLRRDNGHEAVLSFSNYVFDHFVEQMTDALLNGQKLVVLNDEMRPDTARLYQYMNDHGVTYLSGTPSVLSLYDFSGVPSLTRIDAIGEDFSFPVFNKIRSSFSGLIINGYGPTEVSITSHKRLYRIGERRLNKSIGHPVANTKCYVLSPAMKRVPIGGIGELFIGGVGVARGYLNRDDLNSEGFLSNPFQTAAERRSGRNARIYRTGDLVRWLPNGELEYLGRNDSQVKIRGQRIELGEIEAILSAYPGVSQALVIAREHRSSAGSSMPERYLVGFFVSVRDHPERDLKLWMRTQLPQTLVPARILRINEVPLTSSGKVDVRRLPQTDFVPADGVEYVAPTGEVETALWGIWSNVLPAAALRIGVRDDFFGLGGDSLRAIRLAQEASNTFGWVISLADILKHTTIEAQARHIQRSGRTGAGAGAPAVGLARQHTGDLPVSLAQERLLFIDDFVGGTAAYNIPFVLEVADSAALSKEAIANALRKLVRRHSALRTLLKGERDGVRLQCVLDGLEASMMFDITDCTADSIVELDSMLVNEGGHLFRLDKELPIRAALFALAGVRSKVYLSVVVHHTCFDGWSWEIFRQELAMLATGAPDTEVARPDATYADFALWQRRQLTGERLSMLTEYWTNALAGFEPLNLPLDRPRPPQFDYHGREILFNLDPKTVGQLKALAQSARVSFYSVLLGAYCLMLKTFTGQHDIVIGTPSANREPEFADVIGFFANLLVLRVRVDSQSTLLNYIRSVGKVVVQAQVHQELPFEQLVKSLGVDKDPSRQPIAQTVFSLEDSDDDTSAAAEPPAMKNYVPDCGGRTTAKFDLSATVRNAAIGLAGNFTYSASLFDAGTVNHFVATFRHILTEFARFSSAMETAKLTDLSYMDEGERADLISIATGALPRPLSGDGRSQTLDGVFEEVAARWPSEVAVVCGSARLTYDELNGRANQLAHHLLASAELHPNDLVALVMDKSERMVVAILAVWKAGAAYVPIDPDAPDDRVAFMLDDTRARLVVADDVYADRLRALPGGATRPVIGVERLSLGVQSRHHPVTATTSTDLAYAIYTSGTTGRPKAVLVEHRSVISFRNDVTARYFGEAAPKHGVLFLANYVFDFSIEQLVLSILNGHRLIVPASLSIPDDEFYDYANTQGLTYLSGTLTHLQQFDLSRLKHLRLVLVGGETFHAHHFDKIRREYSGPLLNAYGTTETTVYNTVRRFEPGEAYRNGLGKPFSNTRLYVLGSDLQVLPTGAVGELFIAGDCVSAGYLNQTELTRERFVRNPFQTEVERRHGRCAALYKTSDVVRRRVDGELEFLGRNDSQVKIHGLRIELGEVETVLATYPGVRQCAVVVREDRRRHGSKHLVGYYVVDSATSVEEDEVVAFLRAKLMPSMVPALLVRVEGRLPITINGKLATDALPTVDFSAERVLYVAPRSRLDSRLCQMWSKLLPGAAIGVDDDFFRCGGDSITALQLATQLQRELKRKVSVKHIFDFPTIRSFVENALSRPVDEGSPGEPRPLTGSCPMLPIQEWFLAKPLVFPGHWNQYFAIRTPPLDSHKLNQALSRLVNHHDAFRLRFRYRAGSGAESSGQFYGDGNPEPLLHCLDVTGLSQEDVRVQLEEWQSEFNFELGPMYCAAYLHGFDDGTARVWLALHHLIVDAVSWRILSRDLEILYHGGDLGLRGSSYRQWTQAVLSYVPRENEAQLWAEIVDGVTAEAKRTQLAAVSTGSYRERFALARRETQTLLIESNRAYDTDIVDLLLTAVGFSVRAVTRQATNYVTVESHGREPFNGAPDVQDTVGWFTTMHPVALPVDEDLGRTIELIKSSRRRAPHNGIGYGAIRGTYGGFRAPLPSVSFNYLGQFEDDGGVVEGRGIPGDSAAWQLDFARCGSSRAAGNERANECTVDVTMSCVGGRMVAEVDSRLEVPTAQRFAVELKTWLERVISHTSKVAAERVDRANANAARVLPDVGDLDPYILANEGEPGPLLFILPPSEGGAESYLNNLAKQLPGVRLVLFNNVQLHTPMQSFEALAQYYLTHVRHLQRSGPYSLLGWSFGGVLSLEMALQLARMGEPISNLLFIDSFFNVKKALVDIGFPDYETILDPIHYRYVPNKTDLERLLACTDNVVLFKATKLSDTVQAEMQRRLYDYYVRSPFNNLDTLLMPSSFTLAALQGETHFSWVRNERSVATMGLEIRRLVQGDRESINRTLTANAGTTP